MYMTNNINSWPIKKLFISHGTYAFARHMFKIFMVLYIWRITGDISDIAKYYIAFFVVHTIFFTLLAPLAKKGYANHIKIVGLIGITLSYIIIFILQEQAASLLIALGAMQGIFNGAYWMGYHVLSYDITHTKNRGNYEGVRSSLKIATGIIAPLLGSVLIAFDPFSFGYGNVFLLVTLLNIVTLTFGWVHVKPISMPPFHLKKTTKEILRHKDLRTILLAGLLSNFGYKRSLTQILIVFLFIVLGNELEVGGWLSIFSVFSMIAIYSVGKRVAYNTYKRMALYSGSVLATSIFGIIAFPGLITYAIFGIIKEIFEPLIVLCRTVFSLNLLSKINNHGEHRVEYLVIREWFHIMFGGVLSFTPFLFFTEVSIAILTPILITMAVATTIEGILIYRIKTNVNSL
jgi:MFS transporter, YQGE family, putative transporter